jgi:hypothetical protein
MLHKRCTAGKSEKVDGLGHEFGIDMRCMGAQLLQAFFELERIELGQDRISAGGEPIGIGRNCLQS